MDFFFQIAFLLVCVEVLNEYAYQIMIHVTVDTTNTMYSSGDISKIASIPFFSQSYNCNRGYKCYVKTLGAPTVMLVTTRIY